MPTVASQASTLSKFPTNLDTFETYIDGRDTDSAINADIFNKLLASIYNCESYGQNIARVVTPNNNDLKILRLSFVVVTSAADTIFRFALRLTNQQISFFGNNVFKSSNILLASAVRYSGGDQYRATLRPILPDTLEVFVDNIDTSSNVTAGTYYMSILIIGT